MLAFVPVGAMEEQVKTCLKTLAFVPVMFAFPHLEWREERKCRHTLSNVVLGGGGGIGSVGVKRRWAPATSMQNFKVVAAIV